MSDTEQETINSQSEIGEVTITEYRKNQMVRIAECVIISPLCIYVGIKYKELPTLVRIGLVGIGVATLIHSGTNAYQNWSRDGKLIRTAIKTKREEENKIRLQKKLEGAIAKVSDAVEKKNVEEKKEATPQTIKSQQSIVPKSKQQISPMATEKKVTTSAIITNPAVTENKSNVAANKEKINGSEVKLKVVKKVVTQKRVSKKIVKAKKSVQ